MSKIAGWQENVMHIALQADSDLWTSWVDVQATFARMQRTTAVVLNCVLTRVFVTRCRNSSWLHPHISTVLMLVLAAANLW